MKGFENKGNALGRFIEECGEALAAAGKTVRFGWHSYNPLPGASKETNEDWLQREISDLEAAIARLKKKEIGCSTSVPLRETSRKEKLSAWNAIRNTSAGSTLLTR